MIRVLIFRLRHRRAVSTMIGGLIILSLILTALSTMMFVSHQYDQYQQTVNSMAQYRNQQLSEGLVANSPGLALITSASVSGWGSGCATTYNCYNATISNLGGVGVQIKRGRNSDRKNLHQLYWLSWVRLLFSQPSTLHHQPVLDNCFLYVQSGKCVHQRR
jgi:Mn2+/Fe2+ NRAMP family transporter